MLFIPMDRKEVEKYIAKVDEWVQRFHKGEETMAARAYEIMMKLPEEKVATDNLGHELIVAVSDYDTAKVEKLNHDDPIALTYLYNTAQCVQIVVDKARALGVLPVNDTERRLADCTEQNVELQKKLHEGHRRITELENLVRLLGGNPNSASDTFTSNIEKGSNSHE